MSEM
jgi:hypothetical protein